MTQHNHDLALEAAKAAPPVTVVGMSLGGASLQEWVLILTAIYTVLQLVFLIRDKVYKPWRNKRQGALNDHRID